MAKSTINGHFNSYVKLPVGIPFCFHCSKYEMSWECWDDRWQQKNGANPTWRWTWKWVAFDQGGTNINSLRHPNKTIESIEDVWINIYSKNISKYIVAGKLQVYSYAMYTLWDIIWHHNTSHNKIIRHHMTKDWSEQESSVRRFRWIGHRTLLDPF